MAPKLRDLIQDLREVKTWEKPKVELEQYPTPPDIAAHMLFAADAEGDVEDALVADLGCGGCILGIGAALMGAAHVTGVDIDPAALTVAAENVAEAEVSVDLVVCDVTQLAMRGVGEAGDDSSSVVTGQQISSGEKPAASTSAAARAAAATAVAAAEAAFPSFIESDYPSKVEHASAMAAAVEAARAAALGAPSTGSGTAHVDGDSGPASSTAQPPIGRGVFDLVLMNPPFGTQKGSNGVDMLFLRAGLAMCAADGAVYSLNKTSTRSFIAKTAASWGVRGGVEVRCWPSRRRRLSDSLLVRIVLPALSAQAPRPASWPSCSLRSPKCTSTTSTRASTSKSTFGASARMQPTPPKARHRLPAQAAKEPRAREKAAGLVRGVAAADAVALEARAAKAARAAPPEG